MGDRGRTVAPGRCHPSLPSLASLPPKRVAGNRAVHWDGCGEAPTPGGASVYVRKGARKADKAARWQGVMAADPAPQPPPDLAPRGWIQRRHRRRYGRGVDGEARATVSAAEAQEVACGCSVGGEARVIATTMAAEAWATVAGMESRRLWLGSELWLVGVVAVAGRWPAR